MQVDDASGNLITSVPYYHQAPHMTRFGVAKHLRVLENAGLVVSRWSGREKLHFLTPAPIRLVHDRWIDKYTEGPTTLLAGLKIALEEEQ
jgi:hypothetical protein